MKVLLNEHGARLYPWLANEWLPVYGFNADCHSFVLWDKIQKKWLYISTSFCEGEE